MFITTKKHNRLLQEERERGWKLYILGYQLGQVEQGNKGFITGTRWQEEIEAVLKAKGI